MSQSAPSIRYSPQSSLQHPRQFLNEMGRDLVASRNLAGRLLVHNLRAHYRHSALGYLWLLFPPLATALIWIFLRAARIVAFQEVSIPYPVYLITGMFLWQGFVRMLNTPLQQMNASHSLLVHFKFPWEALLLAGIGEAMFEFALYLLVLVVLFFAYQIPFSATMLLGLVGIVILLAFGLAVGLLLTPWGVLFEDVSRGLNIVTMLLFFVIPIVYVTPTTFPGTLLVDLNPIATVLVTTRDWLTIGQTPYALPFLLYAVAVPPLLLVSWIVFRLATPHLIARLGN